MTDPLPADMRAFLAAYRPSDPDLDPRRIRMHPAFWYRLVANASILWPGVSDPKLLAGLAVDVDDTLPDRVWQLCAADGTLLRDSRSTNDPNGP